MKNHSAVVKFAVFALLSTLNSQLTTGLAQGTAFTYQGRLNDGSNPANGSYDLTFTLFGASSGGSAVAGPVTNSATGVSNGSFTVTLDFGAGVFTGPARWVEIGVRTNGGGSFTNLVPRQAVAPAPYAIFAEGASASGLSGTVANGQLADSSVTVSAGTGLSGGGTVALGGSTTLSNAGVTSLTGNTDITASPASGAVTLGDTATSVNTASRIVKRDASGNFSAGSVTLANNLNLPATTATTGIVFSGANTLLHTFGSGNTFAGVSAGNLTMTGSGNTGMGLQALQHNTIGVGSTAIGQTALANNTTGGNNVAAGFSAMLSNTNGTDDTAVGFEALLSNTGGNFNTANGAFALFFNTIGSENTASGFFSLYSNTNGGQNAAIGAYSLQHNTSGSDNTASGAYALYDNTSGQNNTASGAQALFSNTSGYDNTANGASALYANTVGTYNTASGVQALEQNTNGVYNTAEGFYALNANTSGYENTANGASALILNTTGSENTANGYQALYNNTNGVENTANGNNALVANTSGSYNTANGYGALELNSSGSNNIALGYLAGFNITTGSSNIDIGSAGSSGDARVIRIGSGQTNTFIVGIAGATVSGSPVVVNASGQLGVAPSSQRFKQNIHNMGDVSDVLLSLRPVTFKYKPGIDPQGIPQFGLIAEQVEKIDPDLVVHDQQHGIYTVRYEAVNAMLLNEFLKQHKTVESQRAKLQELSRGLETRSQELEDRSRRLEAENAELKSQNESLAQRLDALEQIVRSQKSN